MIRKKLKTTRILVHDYVGYAFPIQLSSELAGRGYEVMHVYSASFQGPKGALEGQDAARKNFEIASIRLSRPFQKYSFIRRRFQEVEYGKRVATKIQQFRPDVVISADTPVEAQSSLIKQCQQIGSKFVFWVQDLYSLAAHRLLRKRIPIIGSVVGRYYMYLERSLLQNSDEIVLITEDFQPFMTEWRIPSKKTHVIPNWAPIQELPVGKKQNDWAATHGLADKFCFLYSGTLGMKHNPEVLLQLATHFKHRDDIRIVVVSEGLGADWLIEKRNALALNNLDVLNYQPYQQLPQVLAAADVLIAVLEPDAHIFSVPSKVLTYMCAQRPILMVVPVENLAARIAIQNNAGLVIPPDDTNTFITNATTLLDDESLRQSLSINARHYAEHNFDIKTITDRFEAIISRNN